MRAVCELRKGKAVWGLDGAQVSPVPTYLAWLKTPLSCPRYQQGWGSQRPFQPESERASGDTRLCPQGSGSVQCPVTQGLGCACPHPLHLGETPHPS